MRTIHYAALGTGSWATTCFIDRMRAHLASAEKLPDDIRPGHYHLGKTISSVPAPRRHTDLTKVTCDGCWREILELGRRYLASPR
jgi:hypothetical protein